MIRVLLVLSGGIQIGSTARASYLDSIGVTLLRTVTTNLNGAGIRVAQTEAGAPYFEVNPGTNTVEQPTNLFTYITSSGSTNYYPNALGDESQHADDVASNFYGLPSGVATNVAHVDNYDANYFIQIFYSVPLPGVTNYTASLPSSNIEDSVVNQSFVFADATNSVSTNIQEAIDTAYDNYAAQYNTLFVSGAGNNIPATPARVCPPATCYNGIGVGDYGGGSSYGPTLDNGRAKPDITTPQNATSWSTPEVSGSAALLIQAGLRGDGGAATNSAADIRTVKALLLNGAVKPVGWTNVPPSPLDTRYGAGILNVLNSYEQLAGGKHGYIVATSVPTGNPHPPAGASGTISELSGWDFNTNSSSSASDEINHYYFNVTNGFNNAAFTATATLVWNRQQNQTNINNLNLFLYNAANSNLVASSTSLVDNVEHIFVPKLAPGRYDLQVWKAGGIPNATIVSYSETYALAWEFSSTFLKLAPSGGNLLLSWPIYPDGFVLASATNLTSPVVWSTNNPVPVVMNGQNQVVVAATNTSQFFRLQPP